MTRKQLMTRKDQRTNHPIRGEHWATEARIGAVVAGIGAIRAGIRAIRAKIGTMVGGVGATQMRKTTIMSSRLSTDFASPRLNLLPEGSHLSIGLVISNVLCAVAAAQIVTVTVPGSANPWLAGMPAGTPASGGEDRAPAQSPTLLPMATFPGAYIVFPVVSGQTGYGPGISCVADGCDSPSYCHVAGAENGIATYCTIKVSSLVGVFLDERVPSSWPPPAGLTFNTATSIGFFTIAPLLKQVFFIGDARTDGSQLQEFIVPQGATRLFLGTSVVLHY